MHSITKLIWTTDYKCHNFKSYIYHVIAQIIFKVKDLLNKKNIRSIWFLTITLYLTYDQVTLTRKNNIYCCNESNTLKKVYLLLVKLNTKGEDVYEPIGTYINAITRFKYALNKQQQNNWLQ